ncbi:hypothetical protein J6590_042232 [Homalodisca vitripennis]|nr:hypothetical protein J6590_042232 [Homalodisca vitripennis]
MVDLSLTNELFPSRAVESQQMLGSRQTIDLLTAPLQPVTTTLLCKCVVYLVISAS